MRALLASERLFQGLLGARCTALNALVQASCNQALSEPSTSGRSMFQGTDPMKWLSFDKMLRPDLYDPEFKLLSKRFKEHGVVVDPYDRGTGKLTKTNVMADPELERRLKYFWKRLPVYFTSSTSVKGFADFPTYAAEAYHVVQDGLAKGDLTAAEQYLSPIMLSRLKAEVAQRKGQVTRVDWQFAREMDPKDVQLVHGVQVHNPLNQGRLQFLQWTVRFISEQRMAAYGKSNRLIAGDPNRVIPVEDYWVFERPIIKSLLIPKEGPVGARWRIIERLTFPAKDAAAAAAAPAAASERGQRRQQASSSVR